MNFDCSVIIPTYNRARVIGATIEAILNQTLPPREVIVVDDGSRDDTLSVLAGYQPAVRVISIENSGSIVARNVGLRAASAPVVAFCDSDDLWRPDFLERMAALWRAEPRTCVAYANFRIVREDVWGAETKFDACAKTVCVSGSYAEPGQFVAVPAPMAPRGPFTLPSIGGVKGDVPTLYRSRS